MCPACPGFMVRRSCEFSVALLPMITVPNQPASAHLGTTTTICPPAAAPISFALPPPLAPPRPTRAQSFPVWLLPTIESETTSKAAAHPPGGSQSPPASNAVPIAPPTATPSRPVAHPLKNAHRLATPPGWRHIPLTSALRTPAQSPPDAQQTNTSCPYQEHLKPIPCRLPRLAQNFPHKIPPPNVQISLLTALTYIGAARCSPCGPCPPNMKAVTKMKTSHPSQNPTPASLGATALAHFPQYPRQTRHAVPDSPANPLAGGPAVRQNSGVLSRIKPNWG
jgi:hypothetical protein